jgi:hypothetical protein
MASMAAAGETLTLPEVTQTVILTRVAGRTPMPPGEDARSARRAHARRCASTCRSRCCTRCSVRCAPPAGRRTPDRGGAEGELAGRRRRSCAARSGRHQAEVPGREDRQPGDDRRQPDAGRRLTGPTWSRSKLYDPAFTHRFRKASPMTEPDSAEKNAEHQRRTGEPRITRPPSFSSATARATARATRRSCTSPPSGANATPDWRIETCFHRARRRAAPTGLDRAATRGAEVSWSFPSSSTPPATSRWNFRQR